MSDYIKDYAGVFLFCHLKMFTRENEIPDRIAPWNYLENKVQTPLYSTEGPAQTGSQPYL